MFAFAGIPPLTPFNVNHQTPFRNLSLETYSGKGEGRTHFPKLGQDFLLGRSLIPR